MHPWQQKAVRDGLKGLLPFQPALRRLARAIRPYETDRGNDGWLLADILRQIAWLRSLGVRLHDCAVVELGTGWKPLLPLLYARCGARVVTVDRERLLDVHTLRSAIAFLEENANRLHDTLNGSLGPDGYAGLTLNSLSLETLLAAANIAYRAPFDFTALPAQSADVIVSRDVLEHVPEATLKDIVTASVRILKPGGVMCHTIDLSDHWEHKDKSISRVNFLRYDGALWRLAGANPQNFQNRLRRYEWIEIFRDAGFDVLLATGEPDAAALAALQGLPLCPRYADVPATELAILQTTVVARRH